LPLTFGLGAATSLRALKVTWPGGKVETLGSLPPAPSITIRAGMGIVARAPLSRRR
jgi:hypothetical protein